MTVRSIVAPPHALAVGVDMHAHSHLYAVLPAKTTRLIDTKAIPTSSAGINRAIAGAPRRTVADLAALRVIEWTASCGDTFVGAVAVEGARSTRRHGWVAGRTDASESPRSWLLGSSGYASAGAQAIVQPPAG